MPHRRIVARPPASQRPRPRRHGRLAPTNGSVTRADIEAIYDQFCAGDALTPPATAAEFRHYLVNAIVDPSHDPRTRAKIAAAAIRREADKRAQRRARGIVAQRPPRTLAAA
jgi:hypothetical protein